MEERARGGAGRRKPVAHSHVEMQCWRLPGTMLTGEQLCLLITSVSWENIKAHIALFPSNKKPANAFSELYGPLLASPVSTSVTLVLCSSLLGWRDRPLFNAVQSDVVETGFPHGTRTRTHFFSRRLISGQTGFSGFQNTPETCWSCKAK